MISLRQIIWDELDSVMSKLYSAVDNDYKKYCPNISRIIVNPLKNESDHIISITSLAISEEK